MKSVSQALENVVKVDDLVNWTDSMISLSWIRNSEKEYKRSKDRFVEITRLLNRLYPVEVEPQVREERQNRNTDFPITFVGNAEQEHVSEH